MYFPNQPYKQPMQFQLNAFLCGAVKRFCGIFREPLLVVVSLSRGFRLPYSPIHGSKLPRNFADLQFCPRGLFSFDKHYTWHIVLSDVVLATIHDNLSLYTFKMLILVKINFINIYSPTSVWKMLYKIEFFWYFGIMITWM